MLKDDLGYMLCVFDDNLPVKMQVDGPTAHLDVGAVSVVEDGDKPYLLITPLIRPKKTPDFFPYA